MSHSRESDFPPHAGGFHCASGHALAVFSNSLHALGSDGNVIDLNIRLPEAIYGTELLWTTNSASIFLAVHSSDLCVYSISYASSEPSIDLLFKRPLPGGERLTKRKPVLTAWCSDTFQTLSAQVAAPVQAYAALELPSSLLILDVTRPTKSPDIKVECREFSLPDHASLGLRSLAFLPAASRNARTLLNDLLLCALFQEDGPSGAPIVSAACLALPMAPAPTPLSPATPTRLEPLGDASGPWIMSCLDPDVSFVSTVAPGACKALGRAGGVLLADSLALRVLGEEGEVLRIPWPAKVSPPSPPRAATPLDGAMWLFFFASDATPPLLVHLDAKTVRPLQVEDETVLAPHRASHARGKLLALCTSGPSYLADVNVAEGKIVSVVELGKGAQGPVHFRIVDSEGATSSSRGRLEITGSGFTPYGTFSRGIFCGASVRVQDPMVSVENVSRPFYLGEQQLREGDEESQRLWLLSTDTQSTVLRVPSDGATEPTICPADGFIADEATLLARQLSSSTAGPSAFVQVTPTRLAIARLPSSSQLLCVDVVASSNGSSPVLLVDVADEALVHVAVASRTAASGWTVERGPEGEFFASKTWTLGALDAEPSCLSLLKAQGQGRQLLGMGFWGENTVRLWSLEGISEETSVAPRQPKQLASSGRLPQQPRHLTAASNPSSATLDVLVSGAEGGIFVLREVSAQELQLVQTLTLPGVSVGPQLFPLPTSILAVESSAFILQHGPSSASGLSYEVLPVSGPSLATPGSASLHATGTLSWATADGRLRYGHVDASPSFRWTQLCLGEVPLQAVHLSTSRCWVVLVAESLSGPGRQQQTLCFVDDRHWVELHRIKLRPDHHVHCIARVQSLEPQEDESSECLVMGSSHCRVEAGAVGLVHEQAILGFMTISRAGQQGTVQESFTASLLGLVPLPLTPSVIAQFEPSAPRPRESAGAPDGAAPSAPASVKASTVEASWQTFFPQRASLVVGTGQGLLVYEASLDPKGVGGVRAQQASIASIESAWPLPPIEPPKPSTTKDEEPSPAARAVETTQQSAVFESAETVPQQRVRAQLVAATALHEGTAPVQLVCSEREVVVVDARGSVHLCALLTGPNGGPVLAPIAYGPETSAAGPGPVVDEVPLPLQPLSGASDTICFTARNGEVIRLLRHRSEERLVQRLWTRVMARAFEAGMPVGQVAIAPGSTSLLPGPLYGIGERRLEVALQLLSLEIPDNQRPSLGQPLAPLTVLSR